MSKLPQIETEDPVERLIARELQRRLDRFIGCELTPELESEIDRTAKDFSERVVLPRDLTPS